MRVCGAVFVGTVERVSQLRRRPVQLHSPFEAEIEPMLRPPQKAEILIVDVNHQEISISISGLHLYMFDHAYGSSTNLRCVRIRSEFVAIGS